MELNKGYKRTESGVIPEEWEVKELGDIGNIATGTTPPTTNRNNYGEDFFFVSPADLGKGKYIVNTEKKLSKLGFSISRKYPPHSVLFTCIGSTIGKSGIAKFELTSNQQINAIFPNALYSSDYLFYYLSFISPKIRLSASEQAVPMINKTEFGKTLVPLPPLPEQTAIATALSDTDAYIRSLESLIAKKRRVKEGAMQELLKPREGWEVRRLGDECELITKGTTPTSIGSAFLDNGINFVKIESINSFGKINLDKLAYVSEATHKILKRSQLKEGDLLFSIAGALGRTAKVDSSILPANTNQALSIIRLKKGSKIYLAYLDFYLRNEIIQKFILSISVQGAQANLSLLNIFELEILCPDAHTQKEIACSLSSIENEINILTIKLKKAKALKQGVMQQLLTGKIRLV